MIFKAFSRYYISVLIILFSLAVLSCKIQSSDLTFEVKNFNSLSNFTSEKDTLEINFNLNNAIKEGVALPNANDNKEYFQISFQVQNNSKSDKQLYYKVFYQNETYKFPEFADSSYNPKANENFYGSWLNANTGFHVSKPIPSDGDYHEIIDSLQILGNPRNEKKYLGGKPQNALITDSEMKRVVKRIYDAPEWLEQVKKKAQKNHLDLPAQLKLDAKWVINSERGKGALNNRWKRNPRVGAYSFLLVIGEKKDLDSIPLHYQDITVKDSLSDSYKNPYAFFLDKKTLENLPNLQVIKSSRIVKAKMKLDFSKGVYVNPTKFEDSANFNNTSELTGFSDKRFNDAHVEQFVHHINRNFKLTNIPMAYDVVNGDYTQQQYTDNTNKYEESKLKNEYVRVSDSPGKTVGFDKKENAIFISNPGFETDSVLKKEHVGIKTRHGLTYGKFTAKIKFPEMISDDYVWNGLTCAFWLIYQEGKWNQRSDCESGYIPKSRFKGGRTTTNHYSEIDIEIVKTSKYWTQSSYGGIKDFPKDNALNDNVMVTCTNWDLACSDPEKFNQGVKPRIYKEDTFQVHRWDKYYKALTSKLEYPQKLTLGKPFYYEIEWKPTEIIWRLGASKDSMKVIGYMNNLNTKIPDNQMIMVVTQEFHDAEWWPTAPFDQNNIPFPLKDITGYIYEMEVE
ncbi:MAG: hypothetical protein P8Q42_07405 [Flavobacteriales bacterium]|nr:hypothetical protein [Flavobacteriales bacterium]